jgi:hypothetical protein
VGPTAKGAARSKTIHLGLLVLIMGYLQVNLPLIQTLLEPIVEPARVGIYMGAINMFLGLGVIIVRFYTDTALADK